MCGHSGGGEILGEGFETSKLSWGGGSKLCLGFCFILNIYLTISFTSFFGLVLQTTATQCSVLFIRLFFLHSQHIQTK